MNPAKNQRGTRVLRNGQQFLFIFGEPRTIQISTNNKELPLTHFNHRPHTHTTTKMNGNVSMDSTIAGSVNGQ